MENIEKLLAADSSKSVIRNQYLMVNRTFNEIRRRKISVAVILAAILLISALLISALFYSLSTGDIYTGEELWQFVLENPTPEGCENVCDYLESWHFPKFDTDEFRRVENVFATQYYKPLPDTAEHAKFTAYNFIVNNSAYIGQLGKSGITHKLIDSYIEYLNDNYTFYRSPEEFLEFKNSMESGPKFSGVGIVSSTSKDAKITVIRVIKGSPAEAAGIKAGDEIVAVDGVTVNLISPDKTLNLIRGEAGTEVLITFKRGDEILDFTVMRAEITEQTVYAEILDNNLGYIVITSFKRDSAKEFIKAVDSLEQAGVSGIIFDLRSNLGGYLSACRAMLSYLVPDGTPLYSMPTYTGGEPVLARSGNADEPTDHKLSVPAVYLCNEYTASAAELFCAALSDYDSEGILLAKGVGTKTYGKGIVQNSYALSSGAYVTLTIDYYNPPYSENFHNEGVIPTYIISRSDKFESFASGKLLKLIASSK